MNLKQIDAAIAAYRKKLDEGDLSRLEFFRKLWGVQDDGFSADAPAYEVPFANELTELLRAERPVFAAVPVAVDFDRLAEEAACLCVTAIEEHAFSEDVARAFGKVKWDRVLKASDGDLAGSDPSAWLADLSQVLVDDGMTGQAAHLAALFVSMALKSQLSGPAAQVMEAFRDAGFPAPHPMLCPVCGSAPSLAHVGGQTSSSGRGRLLVCPQCAAAWEYERVRCARCGTRNQAHLHFFNIEGDDAHRIATCDECGGYIRTLYSEDMLAPCSYEVEDVVMAKLDAVAQDPRLAQGAQG